MIALILRIKQFFAPFIESMLSCSAVMVQGDFCSLTMGHLKMAGKVGALTAFCYVSATFIIKNLFKPVTCCIYDSYIDNCF